METVAQYLSRHRRDLALVRLCRLASEINAEGMSTLNDWEYCRRAETHAQDVEAARVRLDEGKPPNGQELFANPLCWLQAIDQHYADSSVRRAPVSLTDANRNFWLLRRHPDFHGARERQFCNLAYWLKHHRVIPQRSRQGLPFALSSEASAFADQLEALSTKKLRIAIARFTDEVTLQCTTTPSKHLRITGLDDSAVRTESIRALIEAACKQKGHLLVLPELTVTAEQRDSLANQLADDYAATDDAADDDQTTIPLLLLGSFHEACKGEHWRNHARLITGIDGSCLLKADKRANVTFGDQPEDLSAAPEHFSVLDTPLGLFSIAICKDLFDGLVSDALKEYPPDWILSPSISDSINPHQNRSRELGNTNGSWTVLANQAMPDGQEDAPPGYLHQAALRRDDDCHQAAHKPQIIMFAGGELRIFSPPAPQAVQP